MANNTIIKTTKIIYPQIYAYVLPNYPLNEGWIKIGYTERKNVDDRIREQTHTAGVEYQKLWYAPAKFFDQNEWFTDHQLHAYLQRFKNVERRKDTEWFYYDGTPDMAHDHFSDFRNKKFDQVGEQLNYRLRAEQQEAVERTLEYAKTHAGSEFLWNAKPRFGKTLTTYDFACKMNAQTVLIVTNRPAIANSWFDDFEKFIAWRNDYRFISTAETLKNRPVLTREEYLNSPRNEDGDLPGCIAFISLQDLKGSYCFGGYYPKLEWVKDLNWDLLVIDEAHEGVDTVKTDVAFNNIQRRFTLHLSGTPFKALANGRFSQEQIFNWTYADEQAAKVAWTPESEENNPYENLPQLNLFSYQMSQMITDRVNCGAEIEGETLDFAFDLNEFFATKENGRFLHEKEVEKWLDTLTRNEKYPFSTPELRAELKHTFWLLNRVDSAKALAKLLRNHPVFENYEIVLAAGDGKMENDPSTEATQKSLDKVRRAIREHEKTITLSVGQLTTGVTVPEWSAVLMLSNLGSPSLYMQAAFRAQNPWTYVENGENKRKQNAYVFDFAPERTLILYDEFANNLNQKTVSGGGTSEEREQNIRELLNFFPVIAEDAEGKMVELDVRKVLTIPRTIKAQEVVRRGFMSNLLFQNITGIFASTEAREILEQLNPVAQGKVTPTKTSEPIDTQNVQVDENANVVVSPEMVIAQTEAKFGPKVYADIVNTVMESDKKVADVFTNALSQTAGQLAKEYGVSNAQAEQIVKQSGQAIAREVEIAKMQAKIDQNVAEVEYKREVTEAQNNPKAIQEAKERFEATQKRIEESVQEKTQKVIENQLPKVTEEILQKSEEKKKNMVEDDIRARLRGFARTIPSFLMAYGQPTTTLANFDENIQDAVFQEVTGITLDQFRKLRDEYNFFEPVVFNESVQEFLHKKEQLANYFDETQTEDIFDYIPPQRTNQIFTPRAVVTLMLDRLEEENPGLFTDPTRTFADLYVKSGLYLTEIVKRLYVGLEPAIPDSDARLKHILETQIYGFAPSAIIYDIAKNFIFGNFANINHSHLYSRDLTETAKNGEDLEMNFDVVVGNPPYQDVSVGDSTSNDPIYNHFYDLAERLSPLYCLISPARFLCRAGATPRDWNEKMLGDEHLKVVFYEQNSANVFQNTDIKGGVVVLIRDRNKDFGKIGTFTTYAELNSILSKVSAMTSETLDTLITGRGVYHLTDLALQEYPQIIDIQSKGHSKDVGTGTFKILSDIIYFETKPNDNHEYVQILGLLNNQRVYRYVRRDFINSPYGFTSFKVVLPKSNGSGAIGEVLSTPLIGEPLIGEPLIGFTETFISIGAFDTELEAQNCLKYVKSKFARTMLGILKITQDNPREKWRLVPLQDFTPSSDIDWTASIPEIDRQLYAKYNLSAPEIAFIESKVRPME